MYIRARSSSFSIKDMYVKVAYRRFPYIHYIINGKIVLRGNMIYLDNAATGRFKPKSVYEAMMNELALSANPGRSGHAASLRAAAEVERARQCVKEVFNAPSAQVIFTSNCTQALNFAILGWMRKYKGERSKVICTAYDHNSVLRPLYALQGEQDMQMKVIYPSKNGEIDVREIAENIDDTTRLVIATHISNVTGKMTDIGAIGRLCRQKGVAFLADCAQSAGHLKIDMQAANMTFLCTAGHKGLHGPQGSGILIIKEGESVLPTLCGGTGTDSTSLAQPLSLPEELESGTLNTPAIAGLRAGMEWTLAHLLEINDRIKAFNAILASRLEKQERVRVYSPQESVLFTFSIEGLTSVDIADMLDEREIFVRAGLHCAPLAHKALGSEEGGLVRISPGVSNTPRQAYAVASAIEDICAGK